jgi:hypothetical protein
MIQIYWTEQESRALPAGGDSDELTFNLVQLDICEQDQYDVAATVTSHTVEDGVAVTDHVTPMQDRAAFTAYVSGRQSTTRLVEDARAGSIDLDGGVSVAGIIVPEGTDRIGDVHATMRRLCRDGVLVDVDGLRRPIEEWLIESVSSPRDVETSGLLAMDVTLVEVEFAELEDVEAPSPRVERGRRSRNRGRQTPAASETDAVSSEPANRSAALAVAQSVGVAD